MNESGVQTRYIVSVIFALIVFAAGFYALVLYEFALAELIQGAFISMMTLAVQYVFGEQLASGAVRRARQSFEQGAAASESGAAQQASSGGSTVTTAGADTVTVETPRADPDTETGLRG